MKEQKSQLASIYKQNLKWSRNDHGEHETMNKPRQSHGCSEAEVEREGGEVLQGHA